jgi:nicotinamide-nucleotide amidase
MAGESSEELVRLAEQVLLGAEERGCSIATAESCTGGLLASVLTDIAGLGEILERGFVARSSEAKIEMLGIERIDLERHGPESAEIAIAMARGALQRSRADLAVATTGYCFSGRDPEETGLVHVAARTREGRSLHRECHFGEAGRLRTRQLAARAALEMLLVLLEEKAPKS